MVISPRSFFIVASRCTSVQIGFGTTPPKLPECTSRLAWRARSSKQTTPREPNLMVGAPDWHGSGPSAVTARSACSRSRLLAHEIGDVRAADLLLAFEQQDDVAGQGAVDLQMRLDREDLGEVLALVVADAARINPAVADRRLEGRAEIHSSSGSGGCTS